MEKISERDFSSVNDIFSADDHPQHGPPHAVNRPLLLAVAAAYLNLGQLRSRIEERHDGKA